MVKFEVEQINSIMKTPDRVRNITMISRVDYGRSTLSEYLAERAGIVTNRRFTDGDGKLEHERTISVKSKNIPLHFTLRDKELQRSLQQPSQEPTDDDTNSNSDCTEEDSSEFLINLIDSPGHLDFQSEVTASLRVTDGALIVVDCVEFAQDTTFIKQALCEAIKPVLFCNKMDRFFRELMLEGEQMYDSFHRVIDRMNSTLGRYINYDPETGLPTSFIEEFSPDTGNVVFGSGLVGFGFSLRTFAKIYSSKFGVPTQKMASKLWGPHFYCPERRKFAGTNISPSGVHLKRGFVQFIMDPMTIIANAVAEGNVEQITFLLRSMGIVLDQKDMELKGRQMFKAVMAKWLPLSDAILEMVVVHLPSPVVAQKYRVSYLYEGPQDDEVANAIRNCDPNGPMVMYVSKMIPTGENGKFYAFGRVFSGTVHSSQRVRILNSDKEGYHSKIQRPVFLMGSKLETIDECPCGNLIGLAGVDQFIVKSATITTSETIYPIKAMKLSVSPIVKVSVAPKDPKDLPKLIEGMKQLSKSDQSVHCTFEETGSLIVGGSGELHLEVSLSDLQDDYAPGIQLDISEPFFEFRESIGTASAQVSVSNSPNNMNTLYASAEPLHEQLAIDLEENRLPSPSEPLSVAKYLTDNYNWDLEMGKNIWSFGSLECGSNILSNQTKGIQYLDEVKDSIVQTFQWVSKKGVLCEERLQGVKFNILDGTIHSDAIHRGNGEIAQATRRVLYASQLTANPILLEPVYIVDMTVLDTSFIGISPLIAKRRGTIISEECKTDMPLIVYKAYLPATESIGFIPELRATTAGECFAEMTFSHWSSIGSIEDKKVLDIITQTRSRKGISPELPLLSKYHDQPK